MGKETCFAAQNTCAIEEMSGGYVALVKDCRLDPDSYVACSLVSLFLSL